MCRPAPGAPARSDADHSVLDVLRANFEAAYAGNRAPLPVFVHGYWLAAGDNAEQLGKFVGAQAASVGSACTRVLQSARMPHRRATLQTTPPASRMSSL